MIKKYPVKISYGLLVVIFLLFFVPALFSINENGINESLYTLIAILVPSFVFVLYLFLKTSYAINNETLIIKCGFLINLKIDITQIKEIRKTKSIMSAPAPSFDRIEIKYGKYDEVIISPKDQVGFARDLTLINPDIKNHI